MHQPFYGWPGRADFLLPWVRLHATKAYYDMAWMLARHPDMHAVVNFSGSLLAQLDAYLDRGARDDWWHLTLRPAHELSAEDRTFLRQQFFSANHERLIRPHARYGELLDGRNAAGDADPFDVDDYRDLQVWFNLAWCGFGLHVDEPLVAALIEKQRGFSEEDKVVLLDLHMRAMHRMREMWRALAKQERIEISATPLYHPILPLIIDSESARRCMPDHPLPPRFAAPSDADEHVRRGLEVAESFFGRRPDGMWPAEGSVSPEAVEVFAANGVQWLATDEYVLMASQRQSAGRDNDLFRPWTSRSARGDVALFFRDHGLSDLIGFSYSRAPADAAVGDLVGRLETITRNSNRVVTIALDGENPWSSYEDDGRWFLDHLFRALAKNQTVRSTTPRAVLAEKRPLGVIERLHSGSWIAANFRIWIGTPEKNRGWEALRETRAALAEFEATPGVDAARVKQAREGMLIAEGSDWFWWYGEDFESEARELLDQIFRMNCLVVWDTIGRPAPEYLLESLRADSHGLASREPSAVLDPEIDGQVTSFYEWLGAGVIEVRGNAGAMAEVARYAERVHVGFGLDAFFVRVDPGERLIRERRRDVTFSVSIGSNGSAQHASYRFVDGGDGAVVDADARPTTCGAWDRVVELRVPLERELLAGDALEFALEVAVDGISVLRVPRGGKHAVQVMHAVLHDWSV
jgi:alpha-amylase/alpha-mannosidase (GH57 family)